MKVPKKTLVTAKTTIGPNLLTRVHGVESYQSSADYDKGQTPTLTPVHEHTACKQ